MAFREVFIERKESNNTTFLEKGDFYDTDNAIFVRGVILLYRAFCTIKRIVSGIFRRKTKIFIKQ